MKDDTKYITVHIRMNDKEKNTIKKRADLAGKNFSEFIRVSAMGCEIREKADKEFSSTMKKQMRDFIRTLCELERLLYNKDFIDAYGIYFEVWKKEGRFAYLESLKNTIGKCVVPCNNCDIVNIE